MKSQPPVYHTGREAVPETCLYLLAVNSLAYRCIYIGVLNIWQIGQSALHEGARRGSLALQRVYEMPQACL